MLDLGWQIAFPTVNNIYSSLPQKVPLHRLPINTQSCQGETCPACSCSSHYWKHMAHTPRLLLLCDTLKRLIHFLGNSSLFWFWYCMIICCLHMLLFGLFVSSGDIMKNVIICKSILCLCLVIFPRTQSVGVCCSTSFPRLTLLIIFFKKLTLM